MLLEAIFHKSDSSYSYAIDENTIIIKIRVKKNDMSKVILCYGDRYEPKPIMTLIKQEMNVVFTDELFDYYETTIKLDFNRVCYYFELYSNEDFIIYSQGRFYSEAPTERNLFYLYAYIWREDIYNKCSEWDDLIVYQIFVDRFNKEKIDDQWYKKPKSKDKFGGNLRGIIDRLEYICDLGTNCLYLTPIFKSISNHKYDTIDYYIIDENFGDNDTLRELINKCHSLGIKIILDAVFNHTSDKFFAFQDILKNGNKSKYVNWYHYTSIQKYETFSHCKYMPKLNTGNSEVIQYFTEVAKYWIEEFNIDGWRLDVANEIDHKFWRRFRDEIKSIKEDAIIIGEVWDGGHSYLQGDQFDSVMNYPFLYFMVEYFAKKNITIEKFDEQINNLLASYKSPIRNILLNLMDSHDTSRFLFEAGNDKNILKMAVFFMMTSIGIPMIYYGDEVGLTGDREPDSRRGMIFENGDKELFEYYKKLVGVRKNSIELRRGGFKTLFAKYDVYAYERYLDNSKVIVLFNNSLESKQIKLNVVGNRVVNLLDDEEYCIVENVLELKLREYGKYVLKVL